MKRLYLLLSLLVITSGLGAKIHVPQGSSQFFDLIRRYPYAVVHYINYAQVEDNRLKEQALGSMKTAFELSANESTHVLARIGFIGVNSSIAPDLMSDIETRYKLKTSADSAQEFSIVFLFRDGRPVTDSTGYLATLTDAFNQADLGDFIEDNLGDYISNKVEQIQEERQVEAQRVWSQPTTRTVTRVVEQPVYRYRTSYAPAVYTDPYYYDDYYYRRPRFGFGIGFGSGWGRRGWGRRGWGGSRVGFGFGF